MRFVFCALIVLVLHFPPYALFSFLLSLLLTFLLLDLSNMRLVIVVVAPRPFDSGLACTAAIIITPGTIEFSAYLLYFKGAYSTCRNENTRFSSIKKKNKGYISP